MESQNKKGSGIVSFMVIIGIITAMASACSAPDEKTNLCQYAQTQVKQKLTDPDSAKFPECEKAFTKDLGENKTHFFSTVSSKNKFGGMVTHNFGCDITKFKDTYFGECEVY